uniref:Uncharacterized protein n=1 Tax=Tanacetum cinerariifolium TaxID=118510 RepID=A0A6L2NN43_TANCI|nr:hypothetical protein [Tanacetum cinerariifolium]
MAYMVIKMGVVLVLSEAPGQNRKFDEELVIMGDISFSDSDDDDDTESDNDTDTSTDEYKTFRGHDLKWQFPKLTEQDIE